MLRIFLQLYGRTNILQDHKMGIKMEQERLKKVCCQLVADSTEREILRAIDFDDVIDDFARVMITARKASPVTAVCNVLMVCVCVRVCEGVCVCKLHNSGLTLSLISLS